MFLDKMQRDVLLAPHTTFKIGGPAKFFVSVQTKEELAEVFAWLKAHNEPYFILGGGSNILVNDQGFDGLVIKIANEDLVRQDQELIAGAGARLSDLVALSETEGLSGLEWAAGIPGSVGGAVRGNAGAFGSATAETLTAVEFFDTTDESFKILPTDSLEFAYRSSLFKDNASKIIWQATFALQPGDRATIGQKMKAIVDVRLAKQPRYPSAGCVFKNLWATDQLASDLAAQDSIKGDKLACGLVVEKLGLKGQQIGGAKVSEEHANFIVNYNQATAADVLALIALIKQAAADKYNLDIEEEIQIVGF